MRFAPAAGGGGGLEILTATILLTADGTGGNGAIVGSGAETLGGGVTLAPGVPDKLAVLLYAWGNHARSVAAYTDGGTLSIRYTGSSIISGTHGQSNTFGSTQSRTFLMPPIATAVATNTSVGYVGLGLSLVSTAAYTQPGDAAGTGNLVVVYTYVDAP